MEGHSHLKREGGRQGDVNLPHRRRALAPPSSVFDFMGMTAVMLLPFMILMVAEPSADGMYEVR